VVPALVILALIVLPGCGGDSGEKQPRGAAPGAKAATPAELRDCLEGAGVALQTGGDTPLVLGVRGIGILPGAGNILPGHLGGALFVYGSEAEAASARESFTALGLEEVVQQTGSVVLVYDPAPPADVRASVDSCISGGS